MVLSSQSSRNMLRRTSTASRDPRTRTPSPSGASFDPLQKAISFHEQPPVQFTIPKWTSEHEMHLKNSEIELDRAQRKWSDTQEFWIEKVEILRQMKRKSEKFYERRKKNLQKEGLIFRREAEKSRRNSSESSDGEETSRNSRRKSSIIGSLIKKRDPRRGTTC